MSALTVLWALTMVACLAVVGNLRAQTLQSNDDPPDDSGPKLEAYPGAGERPLIHEPGLDDRKRRFEKPMSHKIAMLPVRLLQLPFKIVNYPLERWIISKEPPDFPYSPRYLEMRLLAVGIDPRIGGFGTGSGYGFGIGVNAPERFSGSARLQAFAGATHRNYQQYYLRLDRFHWGDTHFSIKGEFFGRPEEDFYGLGIKSERGNRSNYDLETASLSGTADYEWREDVGVIGYVAFTRNDVGPGRDNLAITEELFANSGLVGIKGRFDFFDTSLWLSHDTRDFPGYPLSGHLARAGFFYSEGLGPNKARYAKYAFELSRFQPLPGYRRILALRLYTVITDNMREDQSGVPIFRMERLGGSRTSRVLKDYRFTDEDLLVGNLEYRFPFWVIEHESGVAMDALTFWDLGIVGPSLTKIQRRDFISAVGFGLRLAMYHKAFWRIDVGWSQGETRLDLGIRGPIR